MRAAVTLALCGGLLSAEVSADTARFVADSHAHFESVCSGAIADPQSYVSGVPNPGPLGNQTVSVSPDGQAIKVTTTDDRGFSAEVTFLRVPGTLTAYCATHNISQPEGVDVMSAGALSSDGTRLAQAFTDYYRALPGAPVLVGGRVPRDYATLHEGTVERMAAPNDHTFGFFIDVAGESYPVWLDIADGALLYHTLRNFEVPE